MTILYGVDQGSKQFHVSVDGQPGVGYSISSFFDFDWYQGPGVLVSESTTFKPRPLTKTPSLAQYGTFEQWKKFESEASASGVELLQIGAKETWKIVQDWIRFGHADQYRNLFTASKWKTFISEGKNDSLEALVIGWSYHYARQCLFPVRFRNPDLEYIDSPLLLLKHEIVAETNRRLNHERVTGCLNGFEVLEENLTVIRRAYITSSHPGAAALRLIDAMPLAKKRSEKYGYLKGDIKKHEISAAFKAVWAGVFDENGNKRPCGFQFLWENLYGGSSTRYRSGVAGAQLRNDVMGSLMTKRLNAAGLKNDKDIRQTKHPLSPYFAIRKQCNRDLKQIVKYLISLYGELIN